jgi:hypothetical protein
MYTVKPPASGDPTPTVQWQVSSDGGQTFTNLSAATSTTLTLNNVQASQNGNTYRAVFSNSAGTATTSAATLTVNPSPSSSPSPAPSVPSPPPPSLLEAILGLYIAEVERDIGFGDPAAVQNAIDFNSQYTVIFGINIAPLIEQLADTNVQSARGGAT